jgi:hypothetical protein
MKRIPLLGRFVHGLGLVAELAFLGYRKCVVFAQQVSEKKSEKAKKVKAWSGSHFSSLGDGRVGETLTMQRGRPCCSFEASFFS